MKYSNLGIPGLYHWAEEFLGEAVSKGETLDFEAYFSEKLDLLQEEGNYRVIAYLERKPGAIHSSLLNREYGTTHQLTY